MLMGCRAAGILEVPEGSPSAPVELSTSSPAAEIWLWMLFHTVIWQLDVTFSIRSPAKCSSEVLLMEQLQL